MTEATQSTDVIVFTGVTAATVFATPGGVDAILDKIREEVRKHSPDISTSAGRREIASLAYKVARSKTTLDDMGKSLVVDLKKQTSAVDAERKRIRDELDSLRDEARKPLTDFEAAEDKRVADHKYELAQIGHLTNFEVDESCIQHIEERIAILRNMPERDWQEFSGHAKAAIELADLRLKSMLSDARDREARAEEIDRLAREAAEAAQRKRDESIRAQAKADAEAKALRDARAAEDRARLEHERLDREKQVAIARAARAEAEKEAAELRARHEIERALKEHRERVAQEKADTEAEEARRVADRQHQAKVHNEIQADLLQLGHFSEDAARLVVINIAKGLIRHVRIGY